MVYSQLRTVLVPVPLSDYLQLSMPGAAWSSILSVSCTSRILSHSFSRRPGALALIGSTAWIKVPFLMQRLMDVVFYRAFYVNAADA